MRESTTSTIITTPRSSARGWTSSLCLNSFFVYRRRSGGRIHGGRDLCPRVQPEIVVNLAAGGVSPQHRPSSSGLYREQHPWLFQRAGGRPALSGRYPAVRFQLVLGLRRQGTDAVFRFGPRDCRFLALRRDICGATSCLPIPIRTFTASPQRGCGSSPCTARSEGRIWRISSLPKRFSRGDHRRIQQRRTPARFYVCGRRDARVEAMLFSPPKLNEMETGTRSTTSATISLKSLRISSRRWKARLA